MFAARRLLLARATPLAAAATVASLAQLTQQPAECGIFGKSKLEKKLEAENDALKAELKAELEAKAKALAEKEALAQQKAMKTQITEVRKIFRAAPHASLSA